MTEELPPKRISTNHETERLREEDVYNSCYGKRRMYDRLVQDFDCTFCYNMVSTVLRENGLLQKVNHPKGLTKADKNTHNKLYASGIFDCYDNYNFSQTLDMSPPSGGDISNFL